MQKLLDIVAEVFVKLANCLFDTFIEVCWFVLNHFNDCCLLLPFRSINIFSLKYFFQCFRIQCKNFAKNISAPLDTMDGFFREHFQCAMRNLIFFSWISLISIVLGFMGNYHLNVALRSQSSAFEQRL